VGLRAVLDAVVRRMAEANPKGEDILIFIKFGTEIQEPG
jgi:hypothetical protein